ncbi:MAG: phosphate signaling complex protein PhoU [Myxococcota bacterium]
MPRIVDRDLDALRELVLRMGSLAEAILAKSLDALWRRDADLAESVHQDDLEIDQLDVDIDEAVIKVLALRAPVAQDLREVVAIKTMATDLERVGDLARNIAKSAIRLAERTPVPTPPKLETLAEESRRLLRRALDAFADNDASAARKVVDDDEAVDREEDRVIREALEEIVQRPEYSAQVLDLILVAKNLERVADHATNIAEDVVLAAEAENLKHASKLSS